MVGAVAAKPQWPESGWFDVLAVMVGLLAGSFVDPLVHHVLSAILVSHPSGTYGVLVTLQGALLGFVLAALAIVVGYSNNDSFQIVRDAGQLPNLFRVYTSGVRSHAVATVVALLALLLDKPAALAGIFAWTVGTTTTLALIRVFRTLWATKNIVSNVAPR